MARGIFDIFLSDEAPLPGRRDNSQRLAAVAGAIRLSHNSAPE
jgi:hypothetical protein